MALLPGHDLPAPQTARDFLEAFDAVVPPLWQGDRAAVPGEGPRLQGLAQANRRLVAWLQERRPQSVATVDVDATILESQKRSAFATDDGRSGDQPVAALWTEQDVVLADARLAPIGDLGGRRGAARSAHRGRELVQAIRALTETAWQSEREDGDAVRHWAEVSYVPSDGVATRDTVLRLVGAARRRLADAAPLALATGPPVVTTA